MPSDRLDGAACAAIRQHAWSLFTRGQAQAALDAVQDLERRLADADGSASIDQAAWADGEMDLQRAITRKSRGRILLHAGRPDLALDPLTQAIDAYRALGEGQQANLSAALGELANALRDLGRPEQALAAADEALAINRALGRDREVAAGLGQTAAILMAAGHHAEAEARYGEAMAAAERVGDLELQGSLTQHLGSLQRETGRAASAVETLKQALRLFQQAGNRGGEMQTCDLLGTAEQVLDRLAPAEAWYRKALALAEAPGNGIEADQGQIGTTRHNLGILFQRRALALPGDGDGSQRAERERWLAAAIAEIAPSLAIKRQMNDQLGAAASHSQLSVLHRLRGDLDRAEAEAEARQALAIWEPLDHPRSSKPPRAPGRHRHRVAQGAALTRAAPSPAVRRCGSGLPPRLGTRDERRGHRPLPRPPSDAASKSCTSGMLNFGTTRVKDGIVRCVNGLEQ